MPLAILSTSKTLWSTLKWLEMAQKLLWIFKKYCYFTAYLWYSGSLLTHSFGPKWSLGTCLWFLVPTGHSLPSLCAIRPFRSAQKPYKNGLKLIQKLDFRCPIWANFVVFLQIWPQISPTTNADTSQLGHIS